MAAARGRGRARETEETETGSSTAATGPRPLSLAAGFENNLRLVSGGGRPGPVFPPPLPLAGSPAQFIVELPRFAPDFEDAVYPGLVLFELVLRGKVTRVKGREGSAGIFPSPPGQPQAGPPPPPGSQDRERAGQA